VSFSLACLFWHVNSSTKQLPISIHGVGKQLKGFLHKKLHNKLDPNCPRIERNCRQAEEKSINFHLRQKKEPKNKQQSAV